MNIKNVIPRGLTQNLGRKALKVKKQSPHIFFGLGVVGAVGSTVLACKATLQLEKKMEDARHELEMAKSMKDEIGVGSYDQKHYVKDMTYMYTKHTRVFVRLYAPSVLLGAASIAALTGSHVQMTRRNSALTATLALVSQSFEDYRGRVRDQLGDEQELDIYRAMSEEEITKENGKKEIIKVTDPNGWSPYARMFDEANVNWQKDAELNRIFIQCQQTYANHLLRARGHVFLNEVYDALGMERSQAGAVVGWVINGDGDDYIDFGLFEAGSARFLNGEERSVILDFNVDGVVYDKI